MPNAAINALTAPDAATAASTLTPGAWVDHINIDVVNQAIYWRVQEAPYSAAPSRAGSWTMPVYMIPGSRTIRRANINGVQFWAAIAAAALPAGAYQAVVTIEVVM